MLIKSSAKNKNLFGKTMESVGNKIWLAVKVLLMCSANHIGVHERTDRITLGGTIVHLVHHYTAKEKKKLIRISHATTCGRQQNESVDE
jgi:hypothetical protein